MYGKTSINPDGSTNGVSGKTVAAGGASFSVSMMAGYVLDFADQKIPAVHSLFAGAGGALVHNVILALMIFGATWVASYYAKHAPAGLQDMWSQSWKLSVTPKKE